MAGVYLAPMTATGSTEDDSKKTVAVPRLLAAACCLLLLCLHGPRGAAGQFDGFGCPANQYSCRTYGNSTCGCKNCCTYGASTFYGECTLSGTSEGSECDRKDEPVYDSESNRFSIGTGGCTCSGGCCCYGGTTTCTKCPSGKVAPAGSDDVWACGLPPTSAPTTTPTSAPTTLTDEMESSVFAIACSAIAIMTVVILCLGFFGWFVQRRARRTISGLAENLGPQELGSIGKSQPKTTPPSSTSSTDDFDFTNNVVPESGSTSSSYADTADDCDF